MMNGIGGSSSYYNSLLATNGTSGSGTSNSTSPLAQTEEQLFAAIDTNGDGSVTQSEFSSFLNKSAAAAGSSAPSQAAENALFGQLSGGGSSIGLQQLQSNAGDLFSQLQSEIAAGKSAGTSSSLLSQLTQSAASLAAGSAAGIVSSSSSSATSNTANSAHQSHHGHGGHGHGGSLISQFMQQYQAAGATPTTAASTMSASA